MTKNLWLFHALFALTSIAVLAIPALPRGLSICGLVAAYNLALPTLAWFTGDKASFYRWQFLLPLSILMVMPDRFLAETLGVLSFSNYPIPYFGSVPLFMAGMWVIPLFVCLSFALQYRWGLSMAGISGFAIFCGAEFAAPWLDFWRPHHVELLAGVALYILPAEVWLATASYWACQRYQHTGIWIRLGVASGLMLSYIGAAAIGHMFLA